jgi:hypothetical protein
MPSARELLDQADALMRRNRKRGKGRSGDDVPTLTDALDAGDTSLVPTLILPDNEARADPIVLDRAPAVEGASAGQADAVEPMSLDTLGDLPVLTDAVLEWPPDDMADTARAQAIRDALAEQPSVSNEPAVDDRVVEDAPIAAEETAPMAAEEIAAEETPPDTAVESGDAFPASAAEAEAVAAELPPPAVLEAEASPGGDAAERGGDVQTNVPAHTPARVPFLDDDFILEIPAPAEGASTTGPAVPAPVVAPSTLSPDSREWDALAEEIRMQVLQRLDLFTDTGLRDQLGARLAPIVERASAQLIETINRELGELVRGYVAEAIEREIDSWRNQQPKKPM